MMTANETKSSGIRFEVPLTGDGTNNNPFRPVIFDTHSTGYYHLESIDEATGTAVVWLNKNRSPDSVVDDIRGEREPLGTVFEETGR